MPLLARFEADPAALEPAIFAELESHRWHRGFYGIHSLPVVSERLMARIAAELQPGNRNLYWALGLATALGGRAAPLRERLAGLLSTKDCELLRLVAEALGAIGDTTPEWQARILAGELMECGLDERALAAVSRIRLGEHYERLARPIFEHWLTSTMEEWRAIGAAALLSIGDRSPAHLAILAGAIPRFASGELRVCSLEEAEDAFLPTLLDLLSHIGTEAAALLPVLEAVPDWPYGTEDYVVPAMDALRATR